MADYVEVTCRLPLELEDRLWEVLGDLRVLGAQILESEGVTMTLAVYLESSRGADVERLCSLLQGAGAQQLTETTIVDRDWLAEWRESARPFAVGRTWWIDPRPDTSAPAPRDRARLAVQPRMAFGSGTHESTRLVLAELEDLAVAGRTVLDVGTGSGILAIAADRLGARQVIAFDLDVEAVRVAKRTATEQDWEAHPLLFAGPIAALGDVRVDIVLCNLLFEELRPLLPDVRRTMAADGVAVLSGVLCAEMDALLRELASTGLASRSDRALDEWCSVTVVIDAD